MVYVAISKLGCAELFFVEPGVKVNGEYYQKCPVDGEDVACDLKDGKRLLHLPAGQRPTAHRAKDTIALLRRETPSSIGPELWSEKLTRPQSS